MDESLPGADCAHPVAAVHIKATVASSFTGKNNDIRFNGYKNKRTTLFSIATKQPTSPLNDFNRTTLSHLQQTSFAKKM
ncbi:MAG: hypothetical protein GXC73_06670 [Chitinophagaceae bacterium]|nr:hypothetical protein [Chitinophagaceae bacterium]